MFDFLLFLVFAIIWFLVMAVLVSISGVFGFMMSLIVLLILGTLFMFVTDN